MSDIVFLKERYEDTYFEGQDNIFVCEGNLKLINCKSDGRIFCTGNLICYKGTFKFIDVSASAYLNEVSVNDLLHVHEKLVAIDSNIQAVAVTGDVTFINSVCRKTAVYDGGFKAKHSEIRNLNRSQSVDHLRIKDSPEPNIYNIRL